MYRHLLSFATGSMLMAGVAQAGTVTSDGPDLVLKTKGGLEVKTADGKNSFKLGGRIQYDYNQSELNSETDEDEFDVRRARLFTSGVIGNWAYKAQFNIGDGNGGTAEDLYIRYNGLGKGAVVTAGKQKMPFGLEELTSSKDISFLERSAITEAYAPGRQEGLQLSGVNGDFTYAVGGFEDDESGDDGFGFAARGTYAPINESGRVVHLGLAYKDMAEDIDAVGVEAAAVMGPFHAQAEYVSEDNQGDDLDGYYLQLGWVITGETRPYKKGVFKRVKPSDSAGAWEVILRYEDGDGDYGDVELGATDASSYGIGINWYANNYVRIGATYSEGDDNNDNDDGSEFRARIQLAF